MDDILVAYDMDHVQDMQYSLKEEEIIHMTYVPISFNITWTTQMLWFVGTLFNFNLTKFNSIIELKRNGKANWWERYWKFTHEYGVKFNFFFLKIDTKVGTVLVMTTIFET